MANYDPSKPAPDRSRRNQLGNGTGTGGVALIVVGIVIVLVLLYAVFGGAGITDDANPNDAAPASVEVVPSDNG